MSLPNSGKRRRLVSALCLSHDTESLGAGRDKVSTTGVFRGCAGDPPPFPSTELCYVTDTHPGCTPTRAPWGAALPRAASLARTYGPARAGGEVS